MSKLNLEPAALGAVVSALFPVLTLTGVLGPTLGGALSTLTLAVVGLFVRSKVMPVTKVADTVLSAGLDIAAGLTTTTVGAAGQLTDQAVGLVTETVGKATGLGCLGDSEKGGVPAGTAVILAGLAVVLVAGFAVCLGK